MVHKLPRPNAMKTTTGRQRVDDDNEKLARPQFSLPVAVLLERRPATSPWQEFVWRASGITIGDKAGDDSLQLVREDGESALFLQGGLELTLYRDECESYYYNIVSDRPRAYVVAHVTDPEQPPEPFRVSMSFDEAHAYLEGDDEIYDVDVPAELYRATETFVLANYFPEKKTKRKLHDWRAEGEAAGACVTGSRATIRPRLPARAFCSDFIAARPKRDSAYRSRPSQDRLPFPIAAARPLQTKIRRHPYGRR